MRAVVRVPTITGFPVDVEPIALVADTFKAAQHILAALDTSVIVIDAFI